jgi:hypothetical protein
VPLLQRVTSRLKAQGGNEEALSRKPLYKVKKLEDIVVRDVKELK